MSGVAETCDEAPPKNKFINIDHEQNRKGTKQQSEKRDGWCVTLNKKSNIMVVASDQPNKSKDAGEHGSPKESGIKLAFDQMTGDDFGPRDRRYRIYLGQEEEKTERAQTHYQNLVGGRGLRNFAESGAGTPHKVNHERKDHEVECGIPGKVRNNKDEGAAHTSSLRTQAFSAMMTKWFYRQKNGELVFAKSW